MRVALLSSEAVPFAKAGGLGDVAGALPKALNSEGAEAVLILPLYDLVDRALLREKFIDNLEVEWRGKKPLVSVWRSDSAGAPAYLIEAPSYFGRPAIYGYRDDHERFAFFCRAALALCKRLGTAPEIIHCNDWPGGFAAVELRARRGFDDYYKHTRTVFSIHNLAYQGTFDPSDLWWMDFGERNEREAFTFKNTASALKAGLVAADALSTVSKRYAQEIQTAENGNGLEWILRARRDRLAGITNGVDYEVWNPEIDSHIAAHFNAADLSGKLKCKLDLLHRFGLPPEPERPIIAIISRLVSQKGYDLIKQAAGSILATGAFFIALGAGEYEDFLQSWRDSAPRRVGIYKGYAGEPLAHQIEAGADIFLMPSLYEPCGLNQMYSMRYGTVPVVRATGGLDDTVEQFNAVSGTGTGFKFGPYAAPAMLEKLREALYFYSQPEIWRQIQRNGMAVDNSWSAAAKRYLELYEETSRL
ncbi:MAG: starch synthase [Blastocatellia bacterium]|jgi:starch synthase|nr:starch synthase [Blastocatellia bacterium]